MAKATFSVLTEKDKQLVLETEPAKLRKLDEDELIALHDRVRRARNRNTKNYRQGASGRVKGSANRYGASKAQARDRARAEVLEDALARVSRRLAAEARATADQLKAERLAAARAGSARPKGNKAGTGKPSGKASEARKRRTGATEKARAGAKASGKRTQAKRDSR